MNIRHKFRVWVEDEDDDGGGRMTYLEPTVGRYDYEDGYVLAFSVDGYPEFGAHERHELRKKLVFMQWTGLQDANGREIYEGDVLEIAHPNGTSYTDEVSWNHIGWSPFMYSGGGETESTDCKVIGNLYEKDPKP